MTEYTEHVVMVDGKPELVREVGQPPQAGIAYLAEVLVREIARKAETEAAPLPEEAA